MSSATADEVVMRQIKLPDEIWLEVFKLDPTRRNGYYGYLKKCCRISKHFRTLIDSPIFDKCLFRTSIPTQIASKEKVDNKTKILLHPVLDNIDFVCADYDEALIRMNDWEDLSPERIHEILAYPCFSEFATFPPSKLVFLQLGEGGLVHNESGVKVKDLLENAIECWNVEPDIRIAQEMVDSGYTSGKAEDISLVEMMLGERSHFEGFSAKFEKNALLGGGLIFLKPHLVT